MLINCVIIEDEPLAAERTAEYASKVPFLKLLATFDNALQATSYLAGNSVDLIFLDIHLGEISGIQFLELARPDCEVIFTTAYHEHALKAFDLGVADYLLKPYTFERFFQAIGRAQERLIKRQDVKDRKFFFVKTEHRLEKILLEDLLYIEGMRDYRKIVTRGKPIMTLQTFTELENELPGNLVCRVHKSYMVALDKINSIERDTVRINAVEIPISETYKKKLLSLISGT